jgi:N-acetylmuramoyl-L-alanine amidase
MMSEMADFSTEFAKRTIDQEARGEGPDGQRAVAHVLMNRLESGRWGKTLAAVCDAWEQFSGWNPGNPNRKRSLELPDDDPGLVAAAASLSAATAERAQGTDPTHGALFYHADTMAVFPPWAAPPAVQTAHIGHHIFYKGVA